MFRRGRLPTWPANTRAADGDIWYVLAHGPYYRGHLADGDPKPGSCGGEVYRINHRTGVARAIFRVGADRTISSPALSPDGRFLAYTSEPCTTTGHEVVIIRNLAGGGEHRVGVKDASAYSPSWSLDGRRLVFSSVNSHGHDQGFVVVTVETTGELDGSVVRAAPDRGCVVEQATFDRAGIALIEGCPDTVTDPAFLVQLDAPGRKVSWRASTGLCPNGATLSADSSGARLLVTAPDSCQGDPTVDIVQAWDGNQSRERDATSLPHNSLRAPPGSQSRTASVDSCCSVTQTLGQPRGRNSWGVFVFSSCWQERQRFR